MNRYNVEVDKITLDSPIELIKCIFIYEKLLYDLKEIKEEALVRK